MTLPFIGGNFMCKEKGKRMKLTKLESIRDDLNRALYELDKSYKKYMDVDEIVLHIELAKRDLESLTNKGKNNETDKIRN